MGGSQNSWKHSQMRGSETIATMVMSKDYSLPRHLHEHIEAVFNTCQIPPRLNKKAVILSDQDFGPDFDPMSGGLNGGPQIVTPLRSRPPTR